MAAIQQDQRPWFADGHFDARLGPNEPPMKLSFAPGEIRSSIEESLV